jgi:hypothetical protein
MAVKGGRDYLKALKKGFSSDTFFLHLPGSQEAMNG